MAKEKNLSSNWTKTTLGSIAKWGSGGTPSRKRAEYYTGNILWLKTGEFNESYVFNTSEKITEEAIKKSSAKIHPKDSVVIAMYGATIGKTCILGIEAATNQACAVAQVKSGVLYNKYLFYFLKSEKDNFIESGKGGAQSNISQTLIKNWEIHLPPLPEQQRIVNRIESLFEKIDKAEVLINEAREGFEKRKEAILAKAFRGELTEKWREEHGVKYNGWKSVALNELCSNIVDCPHSTPNWVDSGKMCLRTTNIKKGYLDFTTVGYVTDEIYHERIKRLQPKAGDILLTREGKVGDIGIIPKGVELCMGQRMMLLRPIPKILPDYLLYYFQTPDAKNAMHLGTGGTTSQHINVKDVKKLEVPVAAEAERTRIVEILDEFLSAESNILELTELEDMINLLKKSILAKAFRGELGTNRVDENY